MPAIRDLIRARGSLRDGIGERASLIATYDLDIRVLTEPCSDRLTTPVRQQVDNPPCSRSHRMVPYRWPFFQAHSTICAYGAWLVAQAGGGSSR